MEDSEIDGLIEIDGLLEMRRTYKRWAEENELRQKKKKTHRIRDCRR